ncbi:THO complex subunit 4C [Linum grandiflorum]
MATSVDMSLDDIIKSSRGKGRGRGGMAKRGRGSGRPFNAGKMTGPVRRGPFGVNTRASQFAISKASSKLTNRPSVRLSMKGGECCDGCLDGEIPARRVRTLPWQHDLFEDSIRAAGITGIEVGTKLYVSNLDHKVSNDDIRELFAEIGDLKRYAVHFDRTGRPSGSAEVVYTRRSDAFAALKKYNNVLLDGKPMKLEVVGANTDAPISARVNVSGVNGRPKRTVVMTSGQGRGRGAGFGAPMPGRASGQNRRGGFLGGARGGRRATGRGAGASTGRGGGGARGGRGGGRGRGKKPVEKSADQLDKELENYHNEAMQS